jgi:hypothetical protein
MAAALVISVLVMARNRFLDVQRPPAYRSCSVGSHRSPGDLWAYTSFPSKLRLSRYLRIQVSGDRVRAKRVRGHHTKDVCYTDVFLFAFFLVWSSFSVFYVVLRWTVRCL